MSLKCIKQNHYFSNSNWKKIVRVNWFMAWELKYPVASDLLLLHSDQSYSSQKYWEGISVLLKESLEKAENDYHCKQLLNSKCLKNCTLFILLLKFHECNKMSQLFSSCVLKQRKT